MFTTCLSTDLSRHSHFSRLFCDKILIDLLIYFTKGVLFSNELCFNVEAEMNQRYERIWLL